MRWSLVAVVLALGCAPSTAPVDAADAAPMTDVGARDAWVDTDAGPSCVRGALSVTSATALQGSGVEWPSVIAASALDRSFVVGGELDGDAFPPAVTAREAFHFRFLPDPHAPLVTQVGTYPSADFGASISGAFVDASGALTLAVTAMGTVTVAGETFSSPAGNMGVLVRDALASAPTVTAWQAVPDPSLSGGDFFLAALAPAGDGYVIAGGLDGSYDFGTTHCGFGGYVAALAHDGTYRWARCLDTANMGTAAVGGVALDSDGNVYVAGSFDDVIALAPGAPLQPTRGSTDGFVARFDADGTPRWLTTVGTHDTRSSVRESLGELVAWGHYVVAVGTLGENDTGLPNADAPLGGADGALVVLDTATGDAVRVMRVGGPGDESLSDIAIDLCGQGLIVGAGDAPTLRSIDLGALAIGDELLDAMTAPQFRLITVAGFDDGSAFLVAGAYTGTPRVAGTSLPTARGPSDLALLTLSAAR